jgi:hypothetical protein
LERGPGQCPCAQIFFEAINEAAEMGRLSAKDKLRLARLKLRGVAKSFYSTQPELKGDEQGPDFDDQKIFKKMTEKIQKNDLKLKKTN